MDENKKNTADQKEEKTEQNHKKECKGLKKVGYFAGKVVRPVGKAVMYICIGAATVGTVIFIRNKMAGKAKASDECEDETESEYETDETDEGTDE